MSDLDNEIVVDLTRSQDQLNESFLRMFGSAIELLIKRIFGLNNLGFKFKGSKSDLNSFANVLARETSYIKSLKKHGLDAPASFRTRSALDSAIKKFESDTGLTWPLK